MSAREIHCQEVANAVLERCKREAADLRARGIVPKLAMIRVGEKPADLSYEKGATRTMEAVGIETEVYAYADDITQEEYIREMRLRNADPSIHGILPFLPLKQFDEKVAVADTLAPEKDVDGATPGSMGKILMADPDGLVPCTAAALLEILDANVDLLQELRRKNDPWYDPETQDIWTGLKVCIVNYSNLIGRPLAALLAERYALVSILRRRLTRAQRCEITSQADVLIAGSSDLNTIHADMVKPGAMVLDASVLRAPLVDEKGEPILNEETGRPKMGIFGSCTAEVASVAGYLTPVPGVGTVTSAMLASNLLKACRSQSS